MTDSRSVLRVAGGTVAVGIASGVGGALIALLLETLQNLVDAGPHGGDRALVAIGTAGVVCALAWWAIRRFLPTVVPVERALAGARMPASASLLNIVTQVVAVGLGASIGREAAPRELGALSADRIASLVGLSGRDRRLLLACGAGAGLAAVYDVPFAGALFTLEVLLVGTASTWIDRVRMVLLAAATSAIATVVAWVIAHPPRLYTPPAVSVDASLLVWALPAGVVFGALALAFRSVIVLAERRHPTGASILLLLPLTFVAVGLLALPFPSILGNGILLGRLAFAASTPLLLLAALGGMKAVATAATVGAGAAGGLLTPALSIGAALGAASGGLWSAIWPGAAPTATALVGAAAFLACTTGAPITAVVLVLELTAEPPILLLPTVLTVAIAVGFTAVVRRLGRRRGLHRVS